MKTILTLLLLIVVTTSCQLKKSDNTETAVTESTEIDNAEDCIDKAETKHCKEYGFRTIKAHVLIREDGKVDLMSFVKKQSPAVETYIRHHLSKFKVSEKMFEGGYVQPGEQFVQLRCLWGMLKGK